MPTVEDYVEDDVEFDDDTDIPLPDMPSAGPSRSLVNTGSRGALLSHIDDDEVDFDLKKLAEQGQGIENLGAPPPRPRDLTQQQQQPLSANAAGKAPAQAMQGMGMNGIMGDLMKMQEAEEQRMRKLEKQLGQTRFAKDPEEFRRWHCIYPIYFDAKASTSTGRRVQRQKCLWWPQSFLVAKACNALGLETVHEIEKIHPADWKNPGRVKVRLEKDGVPVHRDIKNRTQLYNLVATQLQRQNPSLVYTKPARKPASSSSKPALPTQSTGKKTSKKATSAKPTAQPTRPKTGIKPSQPPQPYPSIDDRFPLNSPMVALGVAVEAVKRDIAQEKEQAKNAPVGQIASGDGEGKGQPKQPKMKKVMIRKR